MKTSRLFLANLGLRTPLYQLATPPLGLLYLAAHLRDKHPVAVRVVNQRIENWSYDTLAKHAVDFSPDIIGLSCMTPFAHGLPRVIDAIRKSGCRALIVIGGPHVTAFGMQSLEMSNADIAVPGEGERSFEMILERHRAGASFEDIPGLLWRNPDNTLVANPGATPVVEHIDDIPMPAYDLIDVSRYWTVQSMPPIPRRRYISILSSRGCPYGCMWCHNIFGRQYRAHSPERIVDEVLHYKKNYGINDIEFVDDCFNLQRGRLLEFSEQLLARNGPIRIAFPNGIRSDIMDEQTTTALADAGTYFCSFALESASTRIQELTRKRLDVGKFLDAVACAASRGIFTNGFMMLGFPDETAGEMEETIRVSAASRLHTASFYTVTPFPGTALFDYVSSQMREKIAHIDYSDMDFCRMRVNLSGVSDAELYYYQRKAMRDFFFVPSRLFRITRDFPQPWYLPLYLPVFTSRVVKGLFVK